MLTLREKLAHAVTAYDRRREGKRGYNPYALGLYLIRVDEAASAIEAGADIQATIEHSFNDRLLTAVKKELGL